MRVVGFEHPMQMDDDKLHLGIVNGALSG